ncbi:LytR/AlgR family response regulator transcription factor [Anaerotalea alkaliphila]|uniref:Stage 0 sporulation protein A homolog n=1 Tax=Anaerotalea alkaliphila TaxID=2662126 RepID=A0A7X5HVA3_9FIRM|nr:LytTR family DNA-binding domain-containing protein [Anaerotalea alkaliphila]NDL67302.1 response regulator transcription factor [Anaerotalea alkaliphila]
MRKILVLEDQEVINTRLREVLMEIDTVSQVDGVRSLGEAYEKIRKEGYSLFFVDIDLPDGSGYDFIRSLREMDAYRWTWVVVMTALCESDEQILEAFNRYGCTRYFRKPFRPEEARETARTLLGMEVVRSKKPLLRIVRKNMERYFNQEDIVYVETNNKNTWIHMVGQSYNIGRFSLTKIGKELDGHHFQRIHRSFIVNTRFVESVTRTHQGTQVVMEGCKEEIPVGSMYKAPVRSGRTP